LKKKTLQRHRNSDKAETETETYTNTEKENPRENKRSRRKPLDDGGKKEGTFFVERRNW